MARTELVHDLHGGTTQIKGRPPKTVHGTLKEARSYWIGNFWKRVAEPRVQRAAYFILYLFHATAGIAMIIGQAEFAGLDVAQMALWGGFLTVGGILGAVSVLPGWNLFERVGIISIFTGILIYSIALVVAPATNVPIRVALWCITTAWLVVFAFRAWEIRRYLIAPVE